MDNNFDRPVCKMSTARAVNLLAKDGIIVTEEQAEFILEFLYDMAEIAVEQYLKEHKRDFS
ncbi:hypothetical protein OOZ15_16780 [Galbibacter sp. EGI 63066]|uniref:hypothetical protein n=1 Tax=Galbibacter sp. EGI 63066 TaxID=2993559 RepID=UPI002248AFFA|nr:hypothetical protein [Galbibacter sp. EGI 63066]MCX2681611.1 hypothetical protein [Galbibacter sp. EGI 63066]